MSNRLLTASLVASLMAFSMSAYADYECRATGYNGVVGYGYSSSESVARAQASKQCNIESEFTCRPPTCRKVK